MINTNNINRPKAPLQTPLVKPEKVGDKPEEGQTFEQTLEQQAGPQGEAPQAKPPVQTETPVDQQGPDRTSEGIGKHFSGRG